MVKVTLHVAISSTMEIGQEEEEYIVIPAEKPQTLPVEQPVEEPVGVPA